MDLLATESAFSGLVPFVDALRFGRNLVSRVVILAGEPVSKRQHLVDFLVVGVHSVSELLMLLDLVHHRFNGGLNENTPRSVGGELSAWGNRALFQRSP